MVFHIHKLVRPSRLIPEHFHPFKKTPHLWATAPPNCFRGSQKLFSVSANLPVLDISYKWDHLCLISFMSSHVFKMYPHCSTRLSFLWLRDSPCNGFKCRMIQISASKESKQTKQWKVSHHQRAQRCGEQNSELIPNDPPIISSSWVWVQPVNMMRY